ncbi:hypothetical protein O6H91_06G126400 [Diphasiastrum complanatum]|uniref:Uncharacterized protein n=1 Tax=Diphasiastrum complanatum TaxID=34168 RepID=A0ACC2DIX6_DIPCM|nr:hypothetical protein O6H91_06G126400 [Diphasiastrum complanatum]
MRISDSAMDLRRRSSAQIVPGSRFHETLVQSAEAIAEECVDDEKRRRVCLDLVPSATQKPLTTPHDASHVSYLPRGKILMLLSISSVVGLKIVVPLGWFHMGSGSSTLTPQLALRLLLVTPTPFQMWEP